MAQASQAGRAMAQSPSGRATAVSHRPAVPWLSKSPAGRAMAQSPSGHAMAQSPSGRAIAVSQSPSGRAMAQSVTSWPCHGASSALCQCTLRLPQTSAVPNSSASPPTAHTHLMFIFVLFLSYEQLGGAWRPALGKHSLEIASYSRPCTDDFLREISHKNSFRNQTSVDTQITPPCFPDCRVFQIQIMPVSCICCQCVPTQCC